MTTGSDLHRKSGLLRGFQPIYLVSAGLDALPVKPMCRILFRILYRCQYLCRRRYQCLYLYL